MTTAGHVRAARVQTDGVDRRGHDRLHVVIVGGGVAALEALLALRASPGPRSRSRCWRPNATSSTAR
jgi:hypothetical protein